MSFLVTIWPMYSCILLTNNDSISKIDWFIEWLYHIYSQNASGQSHWTHKTLLAMVCCVVDIKIMVHLLYAHLNQKKQAHRHIKRKKKVRSLFRYLQLKRNNKRRFQAHIFFFSLQLRFLTSRSCSNKTYTKQNKI